MAEFNEFEPPAPEEIEEEILETDGIEEAKLIPTESVTPEEAILLHRYTHNDRLNSDEREQIKQILRRYRPALYKYNPDEKIATLHKNEEIIHDEKEFLRMEDSFNEVVTIPFNLPVGDTIHRMHFDVYPITDSQAVLDIQNNLSLFRDLTENEATVYQKMQNCAALSREELIIRESVERKINEATQQNQKQIIVEFLAMQCKFKDCDSSYEDMKQVFSRIPILYLALLFQRVQDISNLSSLDADKVFQEFSN